MLKLRAAPAAKDVLDAIEVLRGMNADNARKVPADAPTAFIKPRWKSWSSPMAASTGAITSCARYRN